MVTAILIPVLILFLVHYSVYNVMTDVKDWNDRAELYDGPFTPLQETLVFAVTRSSMMEPNGFVLAVFSSPTSTTFNPIPCIISECTSPPTRIAVDTFGLIWRIPEDDFLALRALAESTRPFADHSWFINVPYTCQPADRLILSNLNTTAGAHRYIYTSVFAFAPGRRRLEGAVKIGDGRIFTQLPEEIDVFLKVALQRAYSETWGPRISEEGEKVLKRVMAQLGGSD